MSLQLQPVRIDTGGDDSEGQFVFRDGWLVAVLTRLSDAHGNEAGKWFLEIGFGRLGGKNPTFADLDVAQAWISQQLGAGGRSSSRP